MRKAFAVVVFLALMCGGAWADVAINETNFPDEVFRAYVSSNFDTDSNDVLSDAEIRNVTRISIGGTLSQRSNLSSLKGVEYFTALTYLYCNYSQLTVLDVSKNTALKDLSCYSNNGLTSLDISGCIALTSLTCDWNQLTVLDVSKNTALTYLDCRNNQLTVLDVSKNTALKDLRCYNNKLMSLDVSGCIALERLVCYRNPLTSLDISECTALTVLVCYENGLVTLDVSNNTALTSLDCRNNQLTTLDVSECIALTDLYCDNNSLTDLNVSNNTALVELYCGQNQLTVLDVSKCTALTFLDCKYNKLTELNVSNNTALKWLYCEWNYLTELDVRNNAELSYLGCEYNYLAALDVSNSPHLVYLTCGNNQLTTLDVSKNTGLNELDCSANQLTELDLSKNVRLQKLRCIINHLATIDLVNNTNLSRSEISCGSQVVSPLSVSSSDNASYPYQLNLRDYISSDKIANVSDVQGFALRYFTGASQRIDTIYEDGIAMFAACPAAVTYNYVTGFGSTSMGVTIAGTDGTPTISGTFPNGKTGEWYHASISVSGGDSPYAWSHRGDIPDGTVLVQDTSDDTYILGGTPTKIGTYSFTVTVTDVNYHQTNKRLSVTISDDNITPPSAPTISGTFPEGKVSTAYSASIKVANGKSP
ncbi:MAG: leucine-rich repeat domain-containing protein [Synergistaceae bacterium]|nr:leucine-rich repeat domain-containing protein [Synergistaceae bacterium]